MAITREKKAKIIKELKENTDKQKSVIFVNFANLSSKKFFDLRKRLKKEGCVLKVAKKTLLKVTLKNSKIPIVKILKEKVPAQLAMVFEFDEENKSPKIVYEFSKENENLKILGGIVENNYFEQEDIIELAQLPTKEVVLARLVGTIIAPVSNFVSVLQGNIKGLLHILINIKS